MVQLAKFIVKVLHELFPGLECVTGVSKQSSSSMREGGVKQKQKLGVCLHVLYTVHCSAMYQIRKSNLVKTYLMHDSNGLCSERTKKVKIITSALITGP